MVIGLEKPHAVLLFVHLCTVAVFAGNRAPHQASHITVLKWDSHPALYACTWESLLQASACRASRNFLLNSTWLIKCGTLLNA